MTASFPIPIPIPTKGTYGDAPVNQVPPDALLQAENVLYLDGEFGVRPGVSAIFNDINQRPMGYATYLHHDGAVRTVKATTATWYKLASGAWTDIGAAHVGLTGGAGNPATFRVFPKAGAAWLLGINDGLDVMLKWDGAGGTLDVAGTPAKSKCMAICFQRVIIGNLTTGGTVSPVAVDVSAFQDFDAGWSATQTALLADTAGPIVSMKERGDLECTIYKTDAIYVAIAQESKDPFRFPLVKDNIIGPVSNAAVIKLATGLDMYLALDGSVKVWDGSILQNLPFRVQRQILALLNQTFQNRTFGLYDRFRRLAVFVFTTVGSNEMNGGVVINVDTAEIWPLRFDTLRFSAGSFFDIGGGLTVGDLPAIGTIAQTIGELASANKQNRVILGEIGGQAYEVAGNSDGGSAIPFFWETGLADAGDPDRYKDFMSISHRFTKCPATQSVSVTPSISNYGNAREPQTAQTIDIGAVGPYISGHRVGAQSASVKYSGSSTQPVSYKGATVNAVMRGKRL